MAFVRLDSIVHHRTPGYGLRIRTHHDSKSSVVFAVTAGAPLLRQLGWKIGDRIAALWGRDEDFGKVMLVKVAPDEAGYKTKRSSGKSVTAIDMATMLVPVAMTPARYPTVDQDGRLRSWNAEKKEVVTPGWEIVEGGVLLTIPEDWWLPPDLTLPTRPREVDPRDTRIAEMEAALADAAAKPAGLSAEQVDWMADLEKANGDLKAQLEAAQKLGRNDALLISDLRQSLENAQMARSEAQRMSDEAGAELLAVRKVEASLRGEVERLAAELKNARSAEDAAGQRHLAAQADLATVRRKLASAEATIADLQREVTALPTDSEMVKALRAQLAERDRTITDQTGTLGRLRDNLTRLSTEAAEAKRDPRGVGEIAALRREIADLKTAVKEAQRDRDYYKTQAAELKRAVPPPEARTTPRHLITPLAAPIVGDDVATATT